MKPGRTAASFDSAPGMLRALSRRGARSRCPVNCPRGVDRHAFPRDFAVFARAHRDLARGRHRYPAPEPMPWAAAEDVLHERAEVGLTPA